MILLFEPIKFDNYYKRVATVKVSRGINASSISDISRIPRATVIRKLKWLANKRAKYFKGVTKETSEYLYDCPNHKFATPPKMPTKDNKIKSCKLGITHPCGIVKKLNNVIDKEK